MYVRRRGVEAWVSVDWLREETINVKKGEKE